MIFDFGSVLVMWDPYKAFEGSNISPQEFEQFKKDIDWENIIEFWDGGASHVQIREYVENVDKKLGTDNLRIYDWFRPRFKQTIRQHVPGMLEIVQDLKAQGIRVYGLTNWSKDDIQDAIDTVPAIGEMEGIVVSGIEECLKPDPKFYQILFDRYNIDPEESIFIDDKEENLKTAENLGVRTFHQQQPYLEGAPKFRAYLQSQGLEI